MPDGAAFNISIADDKQVRFVHEATPSNISGHQTEVIHQVTDYNLDLIAHVTQRHISRAVFANQKASTLSMAAMLGAILVGVVAGVDPTLIQGAVGASQGLTMEQQIGFTHHSLGSTWQP